MRVHLCAAHTLNYKTITFLLSFPLSTWTRAKKCSEHLFVEYLFCCYISQAKLRSAHSQLAEIYCSLHNQLPCDTCLCCKRLFSVDSPPYPPPQPCISAVITIHTDFIPSCCNIQPTVLCKKAAWKVQRQNTTSETQGMEVKGGGGQLWLWGNSTA